jgi:cytoskeletal protein CcmA (bactofilin family)
MSPRRSDLSVPATLNAVTGVIDHGCEFEGKLCFQGTVRIAGTFRGEIFTPDTLIVGEGARVHGEIEAGTVIISGEVNGTIKAKHRVEIHRPAIFRGDIFTPSLSVDEGVIFEGSSKMASAPANPARSFLTSTK